MNSYENAVAYCQAIGQDPFAPVDGYDRQDSSEGRVTRPRWRWFLGASPAVATGATELSPEQIARRGGRG